MKHNRRSLSKKPKSLDSKGIKAELLSFENSLGWAVIIPRHL